MANWNDPLISTLYVQFLADLKARDSDLAKMFDVGTPTNVETDSIRWNSSAGRFEKWNGATWDELASIYNINADKLDGSDASDFAAASHVGSGGAAHADVTGAVDGFMKAVDKTKLDNATSAPTANELIDRDASGRARVAAPSAAADIARKDTVDTVQTNLNTHAALTNAHSATAAATANRIARRDGSGRMKVANPSVDADVANKGYVDAGAPFIGFLAIERIYKTSDETVNNSSTLQNDNHLFVALAANERVFFNARLRLATGSTPDSKFAFTVPAGATLSWNMVASQAVTQPSLEVTVSGESQIMSGPSNNDIVHIEGYVDNGGTPGNLQLQWAQDTATESDTKVLENSILTVWRE